jgi:7,8-dihydro-6-hydroxymethylpterin dimethyltransferase
MTASAAKVIGTTRSICPVCGKQIAAARVERDGAVYLEKSCPEHGTWSTVIWRGPLDFRDWVGETTPLLETENCGCPTDCGLCAEHRQQTCCVLYEVTRRCNLSCPYCFAAGGAGDDIPLARIREDFSRLIQPGQTFLQLSGGEPTVRDDLPDIIKLARELGCKYIQVNSNGLRFAADEQYLAACAESGLSFVFMQFDGTTDEIQLALRGEPLLARKQQAIANCGKYKIGVTLVPTLVPSVNTEDIGNIIRFAIENSPAVRGVHFQPVSYFGRYPNPPRNEDRYTLGELLAALPQQTGGLIKLANIAPSHCDHSLCGFHSSYIARHDGRLVALTRRDSEGCCCGATTAEQNREYIGRRWQRSAGAAADAAESAEAGDDFDQFLSEARIRAFTVTAMAFQDAYNLDIERLRQCSLHVYDEGRIVPFCARYLTLSGEQA